MEAFRQKAVWENLLKKCFRDLSFALLSLPELTVSEFGISEKRFRNLFFLFVVRLGRSLKFRARGDDTLKNVKFSGCLCFGEDGSESDDSLKIP